jgi:hypothetical protein
MSEILIPELEQKLDQKTLRIPRLMVEEGAHRKWFELFDTYEKIDVYFNMVTKPTIEDENDAYFNLAIIKAYHDAYKAEGNEKAVKIAYYQFKKSMALLKNIQNS